MVFNSLLRRSATSSMFPLLRRSVENFKPCVVGGQFLPFLRFSTTATTNDKNIAGLIQSVFEGSKPDDPKAITNPADYPFKHIFLDDQSNLSLSRAVDDKITRIEFLSDTYKVNDGNPSISMNATVEFGYRRLGFEATAEPEMFRIQNIQICDESLMCGHLSVFEEYLGTRGINARNLGVLFNCFRNEHKE